MKNFHACPELHPKLSKLKWHLQTITNLFNGCDYELYSAS